MYRTSSCYWRHGSLTRRRQDLNSDVNLAYKSIGTRPPMHFDHTPHAHRGLLFVLVSAMYNVCTPFSLPSIDVIVAPTSGKSRLEVWVRIEESR